MLNDFLRELNLEQYLEIFDVEGIDDIETLVLYSEEELIKLNVKNAHIKKIKNALNNSNINLTAIVEESTTISYPKNLEPGYMITYLAHPWDEYVQETHPSVKLHWLIDASETVVRWICALLLAEIKDVNGQNIPENIQNKFKENISRPTLGVWLNIVRDLSEIKIENSNIKNIFSFYNDVLNKEGLFPDDGDEKTSLLKLRNRVAHGGGLSQFQSKIYLDIYEPHLVLLFESVNNLMDKCKLYGIVENKCYFLQGLKPTIVENNTTMSGPFIEINSKKIALWPLVEFDKIRQIDNNGSIKELATITPQTYLRTDKQGVQYVPIGVDESYSITNKQQEFENIFGLNKKNENSSKIKNYEYTYKDFLVEARYLKEELIGRVDEIKTIKHWIKNVDAFSDDKCRLIYGGPGLGKSMIMASVVADISNDLNHHMFYYRFRGGDGRNSKFWFLKLLNDSLYSWDKLREICPEEPAKTSNSDDLFKDITKRIEKIKDLEHIQRKIGKDSYEDVRPTFRLFIDGLDEITAQDSSMVRVIEFLQKEGVLTIIASRLENTVSNLKELSWIKPFVFKDDIDGLPPMSNNDIRAMLLEGISKSQKKELIKKDENSGDIVENEIVKAIEKKANGLPLYIYLLIEDINKNKYSILDIDKLPDGLIEYYSELVDRMGISSIKEYLTKVITLLSLTTEPLDIESIALSLVDIDEAKDRESLIKDVVQAAGTLVKQARTKEDTIGYILYHQSFRDFILKGEVDNKHSLYYTLKDIKKALYSKALLWQELPISNFKNHIFRSGNYYTLWWQNNGINLVKDRLMNLEYLLDRTKSLKVEDLNLVMDEYELIETKIEKEDLQEFRIWSSFFREKMHLINKIDEELWRPYQSLFQLAYEDGLDSPLSEVANLCVEKEIINWSWFKLKNTKNNYIRNDLFKTIDLAEYIDLNDDSCKLYYLNGELGIKISNFFYKIDSNWKLVNNKITLKESDSEELNKKFYKENKKIIDELSEVSWNDISLNYIELNNDKIFYRKLYKHIYSFNKGKKEIHYYIKELVKINEDYFISSSFNNLDTNNNKITLWNKNLENVYEINDFEYHIEDIIVNNNYILISSGSSAKIFQLDYNNRISLKEIKIISLDKKIVSINFFKDKDLYAVILTKNIIHFYLIKENEDKNKCIPHKINKLVYEDKDSIILTGKFHIYEYTKNQYDLIFEVPDEKELIINFIRLANNIFIIITINSIIFYRDNKKFNEILYNKDFFAINDAKIINNDYLLIISSERIEIYNLLELLISDESKDFFRIEGYAKKVLLIDNYLLILKTSEDHSCQNLEFYNFSNRTLMNKIKLPFGYNIECVFNNKLIIYYQIGLKKIEKIKLFTIDEILNDELEVKVLDYSYNIKQLVNFDERNVIAHISDSIVILNDIGEIIYTYNLSKSYSKISIKIVNINTILVVQDQKMILLDLKLNEILSCYLITNHELIFRNENYINNEFFIFFENTIKEYEIPIKSEKMKKNKKDNLLSDIFDYDKYLLNYDE